MEPRTEIIPVQVTDDVTVMVEATSLGGEEDVASQLLSFSAVTNAIEAISGAIASTASATPLATLSQKHSRLLLLLDEVEKMTWEGLPIIYEDNCEV